MIRLFRNLRQKLFSKVRISSYLGYAIGEILLVMIGILLALQVNNWNEENKSKKLATSYLEKLLEDLSADTLRIDNGITSALLAKSEIETYFNFFNEGNFSMQMNIDSAWNAVRCCSRYFPINNTFIELQSTGNLSLLPEKIREALIDLNNRQNFFQIIIEKQIDIFIDDMQEARRKLYILNPGLPETNFFKRQNMNQSKESKIQGLMYLHNRLSSNYSELNIYNQGALGIKSQTRPIIEMIKKELNKKTS